MIIAVLVNNVIARGCIKVVVMTVTFINKWRYRTGIYKNCSDDVLFVYKHISTHSRARAHTHTHIRIYTHIHTNTYTQTQIQRHTHKHKQIHTHTHTHTTTHTHIYTLPILWPISPIFHMFLIAMTDTFGIKQNQPIKMYTEVG